MQQTHLQAGDVSLWEGEGANDVLTESVNSLKDAELCHFPTHIGDIKHVWTQEKNMWALRQKAGFTEGNEK